MDLAITKMSSKGQIVIPTEMRSNISEGEKLILINDSGRIIIKKISELDKNLEEDLKFAKKTEDALLRIETSSGNEMEFDDFIDEVKRW